MRRRRFEKLDPTKHRPFGKFFQTNRRGGGGLETQNPAHEFSTTISFANSEKFLTVRMTRGRAISRKYSQSRILEQEFLRSAYWRKTKRIRETRTARSSAVCGASRARAGFSNNLIIMRSAGSGAAAYNTFPIF